MQIKIMTLPFDGKTEGFDDELVAQFCQNKQVHRIESHFFRQEGQAYWSVAIHYDTVLLKKTEKVRDLDEAQQLLFQRLREWRREQGAKAGIPVYLIATNAQLVAMIKLPVKTLESYKLVKGFGKQRIEKYGRTIINMVKAFYEEQEKQPANPPANKDQELPPFAIVDP
jgi:superfamily II DNA helicase RecQ